MALIKCPECEQSISDKASKCPKCGYPIQEYLNGKTEEAQTENVNETSVNIESSADIQQAPTQKKSKKKLIIALLAVCVVVVAALAIVFGSSLFAPRLTVEDITISKWRLTDSSDYGDYYEGTITSEQKNPFIAVIGQYEDEESTPEDVLVERKANRFASAFLMPATSFKEDCPRSYRQSLFISVKKYWRVSIAAALYRARELGIISENSYKSALIRRSRAGTRTQEEEEFQHAYPTLLDQAMKLISHEVRLDEMADELGMRLTDLRELLELQKVSPETLDAMMPQTKKATILDFSLSRG